ncbi:TPA: hypothetical protein EYP83_03510 [Candidatus Geothermarchaeota archaeon]|nr:hypothetical protein [Candidatus Geothermarchaeota archaeon]HIQ13631.1 hypothetical protein [Thermoprotei archaeon]
MAVIYRINLDYYNSYHDFKLKLDGRLYRYIEGGWSEVEGVEIDPDERFILFFERVFTHYLRKLTFNDIVTADDYELEVYMYESNDPGLISIHRCEWERPIPPITYYHVYKYFDGDESFGDYEKDKLKKFILEHGINYDL